MFKFENNFNGVNVILIIEYEHNKTNKMAYVTNEGPPRSMSSISGFVPSVMDKLLSSR